MPTANVKVVALVVGLDQGTLPILTSQDFATALGEAEYLDLANGNNTITRPTSPRAATGVIIIPPSGNTNALSIRGVAGDTGLSISPNRAFWWPMGTPPTNFVINSTGATNGVLFVWI